MSKREENFFGIIGELFGEKTSRIMFNLYVDFVHDMKVIGLILSYPFMFIKFWKQSYNKIKNENNHE